MASPLGKYGELVAAIVAILLVVAWLGAEFAAAIGFASPPDAAVASAAALAIGVILGQRATTNGAAKIAAAAHKRLDAIGAPPADAPPA